jgi:putative oxidoreductase
MKAEVVMAALATIQPGVLSLLRSVSAFLFSLHGMQKMLGVFGGMGGKGGVAVFPTLAWWGGLIEFAGGLLLLLGLFSRPVAFLLSGQMAVAYFMFHQPRGFLPISNGGELAALYSFVFLYVSVAGPGPLSLDGLIRRKT